MLSTKESYANTVFCFDKARGVRDPQKHDREFLMNFICGLSQAKIPPPHNIKTKFLMLDLRTQIRFVLQ